MDKYTWRQIEAMLKEGSHKRVKRRIMSALAMVVSFVTVAMLVLPAVAMVGDPVYYCGMEEHVHTDECLGAIPVHKHTAECYDADGTLVCEEIGAAGYGYERVDVYHKLVCGYSGTKVDLKNAADVKNASASNWENKAKEPADLTGKGPAVPSVSETEVAPAENESASAPAEEEVLPEEKNGETTADEGIGTTEADETGETVETAEAGETIQESTEAEAHEEIRETEESTEEVAEEPEEAENEEENLDEAEDEADADTVALSVPSIIRHIVAAVASNAENDLTDPSEAGARENVTNEEENDEPEEPEANVTGDENEDDDDSENPADTQEADQVTQPAADVTDAPADENVSNPTDETEEGNNSATEAAQPTETQPAEDGTGNTEGTIPETGTQATVPTTGSSQTVENATETRPASDSNWELEEGESYVPQEGDWILICGLEEGANHHHTEDCYLPFDPADYEPNELYDEIIWNQTQFYDDAIYDEDLFFNPDMYLEDEEADRVHVHTPDCFASYEIVYICGKKEHVHTDECKKPRLREGQWEQIQEVERMIEALPDIIDIEEVVTEEEAPEGEIAEEEILADEGLEEENTLEEDIPLEGDAAPQAAPFSINKIGTGLMAGLKKIANVPTGEAIEDSEEEERQERQTTYVVPEFSEEDLLQNQEVLLNAQESIEAAQEKYDALDNEAKAYVSAKNRIKLAYLEEMSYGIMTIASGTNQSLNSRVTKWQMGPNKDNLTTVEPGTVFDVKDKDKLTLRVEFKEDKVTGGQFDTSNEMVFELPEGIDCEDVPGPIEIKNGNDVIGTYRIKDNKVYVNFAADEAKQDNGKYYMDNTQEGTLDLELNVEINSHGSDKDINVKVEGEDITIKVHSGGEPEVDKTSMGYDPKKRQIEYKVTLKAKYGNLTTGIVFKDEIGAKDESDKKYIEKYDETSFVLKDKNGTVIDKSKYNLVIDNTNKTFTLTYNDPLLENEELVLEYAVDVDEKNAEIDVNGNAHKDKGIDNTITVTSDGKSSSDDAREELLKDDLSKHGEVIQEEINGEKKEVIHWDVTFGDGSRSVLGAEVTDTIGDNQEFFKDGKIDIDIYDNNGQYLEFLPDEFTYEEFYEAFGASLSADGKTLTYHLPDKDYLKSKFGSKYTVDEYDQFYFNVEYYTLPVNGDFSDKFLNTVTTTINGQEMEDECETIGEGEIVKNVVMGTSSDGEDVLVYTIEVDAPAGPYKDDGTSSGGRFYLEYDKLRFKEVDGKTYYVQNIPKIRSIIVEEKSTERKTFEYVPYRDGLAEDQYYYTLNYTDPSDISEFQILFNTTETGTSAYQHSNWPHDKPTKIIITYEIPLTAKVREKDASDFTDNLTVESLLNEGYVLRNKAKFRFGDKGQRPETEVDFSAPKQEDGGDVVKEGVIDDSDPQHPKLVYTVTFKNWTDDENRKERRIKGRLVDNTTEDREDFAGDYLDSLRFEDTFNTEALQYVEGSLKVEAYRGGRDTFLGTYAINEKQGKPVDNVGNISVDVLRFTELLESNDSILKDGNNNLKNYYSTLAKTIDHGNADKKDGELLIFTYELEFREGYPKKDIEKSNGAANLKYENEVMITTGGENGETFGDKHTLLYPTGNMTKSAVQEQGTNIFDFTIELNKGRINLVPSPGDDIPDPEYFELSDEMSSNLKLVYDSFSVKIKNEDGTETDYTGFKVKPGKNIHSFSIENLPDNQYLIITYKGQVDQEGTVTITNNASVIGAADASTSTTVTADVTNTNMGGSGSRGRISIVKQDKDTEELLAGAVFELYCISDEDLDGLGEGEDINIGNRTVHAYKIPNLPVGEESEDDQIGPEEPQTGEVWTWVTDDNGQVIIDSKFLYDVSGGEYFLKEIKAPDGYMLPDNQVVKVFTYGPANEEGKYEYTYGDQMNITNVAFGVVLPETGGAGTIPVTLAGLVMSLGAAYVWYDRRSGEEEEDTDQRDIC